jgi:NADPH:quinone reductase-like Zn-dependent oxidoreductase
LIFIEKAYHAQKGDWILVQGASGGVGLWLCQLLKAVGARVIGTASTEEKMKLATENGADFMLNYSHDNVLQGVMEITKGEGVAAVFDSVGASTFEIGLQALSRDGTMVSYGNTSGSVPPFQITELSAKNLKLMRPSVFGKYPGSRFLPIWGASKGVPVETSFPFKKNSLETPALKTFLRSSNSKSLPEEVIANSQLKSRVHSNERGVCWVCKEIV